MDGLIVKETIGTEFSVTASPNVTSFKGKAVAIGNVVIIEGQFIGNVGTGTIITVPSQYRPSGYVFGSGFVIMNGAANLGYYELGSNGNLTSQFSASTTSGCFMFVYTI